MIRVLCMGAALWMSDEPILLMGIAQACLGVSLFALTLAALLAPPVPQAFHSA